MKMKWNPTTRYFRFCCGLCDDNPPGSFRHWLGIALWAPVRFLGRPFGWTG
jgi:hypothetical protein